jgi:hypothetical protein
LGLTRKRMLWVFLSLVESVRQGCTAQAFKASFCHGYLFVATVSTPC